MTRPRILSAFIVAAAWAVTAAPLETEARADPTNELAEAPDASVLDADASTDDAWTGPCPPDMVEVSGNYCPELTQRCLRWLRPDRGGVERCALFAPSGRCKKPTVKKHFCIDRYEWPNQEGQRPVVMKTWTEAQETCRAAGKRLCGDSEWTLACEGKHRLPYPYGRRRSAKACNIDRSLPQVNEKALVDPKTSAAEVARLWQGEVSGARPECKSPYGVFDMTGNVDEWVVNENGKPYKSGSKGGYWGPVRARCRPMTAAHGETFPFYQTGFRCCADPRP